MRDKPSTRTRRTTKYQQKLERLTHENKKLKQSPLFVATVQEMTDDGVVIKQHGNNQEALTEVTDELRSELEPDSRVAVNNSLSIVKSLDDETDVRARVMQVDQSPEVTYADIGGIEEQMDEVRETVEMPLEHPEMFEDVGIDPPSGRPPPRPAGHQEDDAREGRRQRDGRDVHQDGRLRTRPQVHR